MKRFVLYSMVGAIGTLFHYLTLIILVNSAFSILTATSTGFVVGALINYALNYHVTFRSSVKHQHALVKFMLVASLGLVVNGLTIEGLTQLLSLHYLIAQVIATILVLITGYLINHFWTFKTSQ